MSISAITHSDETAAVRTLWFDLTRKCQLACAHCFNDSGPTRSHGTMARRDWLTALDQAAEAGVQHIQLIGGEPTLHPDAIDITHHAITRGLTVEIFTNLVSVSAAWWDLFASPTVSVATSYYSPDATTHDAMTGRPSHTRTRANIREALHRGIDLRVGIITDDDTDVHAIETDLRNLGVARLRADRVRRLGRAAQDRRSDDPSELCARCGTGRASISPSGDVTPCAMATWMVVGNVRRTALADILTGEAMTTATTTIRAAARSGACEPDEECSPGFPGSGCNPRN